jgi:6-pyruvoyltetrahydropterin/6-carboxytetrahydropterin synthase
MNVRASAVERKELGEQVQVIYCASTGFEAARNVDILPAGHRSRRLHGHSFLAKVRASLANDTVRFPGAQVGILQHLLAGAVAPLDYDVLNAHISIPTDENIARWIRERFTLEHVNSVGVQSTRDEGVDLDSADRAHIWRRYSFEAAHKLPNVPHGHKCGRMHGHGFEVIIHATQDVSKKAMGVDYDHIDALWNHLHAELNYSCLNEIKGLENPTSELIASWLWRRLIEQLPQLAWVTVYETASCGAHFDGSRYRIWKEMTLDSAVRLVRSPVHDTRRSTHGHTYTLRLHLDAPLDELMGWTVDFGDVKEIFNPIFKRLDHQPLYELPGLEDNDVESVLRWIRKECAGALPALNRIDLYETRGCGAILSIGDESPALPI